MKKHFLLFSLILLLPLYALAQVTINESAGWLESAYVKWQPVAGATSYNVYYTGGGAINQKIDNQLIRNYGTYYRADVMGIKAGSYTVKVIPVTNGVEGTGAETAALTVVAQDRNGFAFDGGRVPGGYKADGTPKDGAVILYVSDNSKNTVTWDVVTSSKGTVTNCVGLQNILYAIKKGYDTRPYIIRLLGNITDLITMEGGDIVIENANNANSYLTLEGVGDDAVANGWGVRIKTASNIEVRNMAAMNCNSTAGDDFGLQQDNDHIWVHNCDMFYGNAGSDADQIKGDGALDNKNSTYITFSYNHFWDNGKCSLLGLSEGTTVGLYITYHHNWFDHSDSRHPRVRYYSAHVYNNYYDGVAKYGVGSTLGSSVFVEGNYFRNCKRPMMTSLQGTDIWDEANQKNNPSTIGTFSGEAGGTIKAFNNKFDYDGKVSLRFVPYASDSAAFNIAGKISSLTDFDAYLAKSRGDTVPSIVKSKSGGNMYNNFDTDATKYVKTLVIDQPDVAKSKTMQYAGRVNGGDLKFTFDNAVDDAAYLVNPVIKAAVTNYVSSLVSVQGETVPVGSQTLTSTSNNNQTVQSGTAISSIVFTWGADATDATITGIPANGITFVKNTTAKTITITGTPTDSVSYSIITSGTKGTPAAGSGLITVSAPSSQTLSTPANNNQTVTSGTAISAIVFTWGGDATDATVTGLPASGLDFVKDATTKTITITGTPTATVSYSVATTGNAGTSVSGSGTVTVAAAATNVIHNFTVSDKTSTFFTITGNMNSSPGTVTYAGLTLSKCLKIESSTSITFTTTAPSTLTLVFDAAFTGTIKVNTVAYTAVAGVVTVPLVAGANTIAKGSVANLYYMSVVYSGTDIQNTVANAVRFYPNPVIDVLSVAENIQVERIDIYNLAGVLVLRSEGNSKEINMSSLSGGSYLVKAFTKQGVVKQLIVKK